MIDKIFDLIPVTIIFLCIGLVLPLFLNFIGWLILIIIHAITTIPMWKWLLRDQNWDNIRYEVKSIKEGKIYRPMLVGFIIGCLFMFTIIIYSQTEKKVSYFLFYCAGLVLGIVLLIFYLKNHCDEMDSNT